MFGPLFLIFITTVLAAFGFYVSSRPTVTAEEQGRIVRGEPVKRLLVRAEWDEFVGAWFARSDDVPGLSADAATVEELDAKLKHLVPFLLEANGRTAELATPVELIARRFSVPAAA